MNDPFNTKRRHALRTVGRQLFGLSNLIGTDFDRDITAHEVKVAMTQDRQGVRLAFTVGWTALGKALDSEGGEALAVLLDKPDERTATE